MTNTFPLDIHSLTQELKTLHQAHTIILYGSRAQGTETPASDIDVLCFSHTAEPGCDARRWGDYWLDAWLHPDSAAAQAENFLFLAGAKVLIEENDFGRELIRRVESVLAHPRKRLSAQDFQHRRVWLTKTLARIKNGDPEAWYRRHWMIAEMLEIHFEIQAIHFLGFKRAMLTLQQSDPELHQLFLALYSSEPELKLISEVVTAILKRSEARLD